MIIQLFVSLYLYFVFVCVMFDVLMSADGFASFQSLVVKYKVAV